MKRILVQVWETVTLKRFVYENVTRKLANNLSERFLSYSKYLITIASSSIGFTFAVLQFVPKDSHLDLSKLKVSWILFGASLLFGLIFHILEIIRNFCIENVSRLDDNLKFSPEIKSILEIRDDEIRDDTFRYDDYITQLVRFSYIVLILETFLFFIGVPFLVWFLLTNF